MDMRKFGHYLGMIVTAPGRELYRGCGRLKERQDIVRTALLVIVLALLTILLWLLRGSLARMLIFGIVLAVIFFYLYFLLLKHTEAVIGFAEKMSRPFDAAFSKHAHAVYGKQAEEKRQEKKREQSKAYETKARTQEQPEAHGAKAKAQNQPKAHGAKAKAQEQPKAHGAETKERKRSEERGKNAGASAANKESKKESAKKEHDTGQRRQQQKESGSSSSRTGRGVGNEAFEEAQLIYAVRLPYTTDEIKQKRNLLLKKYHPDNAEGSEEMCKKINECYRILSRYAS